MAMLALGGLGVPVVEPFLELPFRADLHRGQALAGLPDLGAQFFIGAEDFGGGNALGEGGADEARAQSSAQAQGQG